MNGNMVLGLAALLALVPASLLGLRRAAAGRDAVYWSVLAVAVAGPLAWAAVQVAGAWQTGFSTALWVTVAASMVLFAGLAAFTRQAWRLMPLLAPCLLGVAALAAVWQHAPARPLAAGVPAAWVQAHIVVSVLSYALVTVAAVAGLAAFLQERALKAKRPTALTRLLPSVADCEGLMVWLLVAGEALLALGLATGIATNIKESRGVLPLDHKTVFTLVTFVVIGGLLAAHFLAGLRGRVAARFVLLAYLLLTLGYVGVKFVTDVLMG
jgi:ABC-type uncharacterized transport system permease subunit